MRVSTARRPIIKMIMPENKNIDAVIFRAQSAQPDEEYEQAAQRWQDLEHIQTWKANAEHLFAQKTGKSIWFSSYQIQVVEVIRVYRHDVELNDSNRSGYNL